MGRLFWKIFFWFWVALVLLNLSIGWSIKLYYGQLQESDDRALQERVQEIAQAFEAGRIPEAQNLLEQTRKHSNSPIFVVNEDGEDFLNRPLPGYILESLRREEPDRRRTYTVDATLPGGGKIQLLAVYRPSWLRSFRSTPVWMVLSIIVVISTLVCYWLARYLAVPIQRLSTATRQLAAGNLNVRVGAVKRKDEIADLAVDFDLMADKIEILLNSQKQLLQDISHELRSPLARLQVALALAMRKNAGHSSEYERIAKDLNRLEELIGEVLTLSRLDTVTYPTELVDLTALTTSIIEDNRLEASAKNCSILTRCDPNLEIQGSPELLRRAIENVLRNAIKFTDPDSKIEVHAENSASAILLQISDQGPGIPDVSKENMFEAFVRIDPARPHKPGGYGLGLAIAKKAIELHGGSIRAENCLGGGLTVSISLPVESPPV